MRASTLCCFAGGLAIAFGVTANADYTDAVLNLNPTHYYPLNETEFGVVIDLGSGGINGTHEGNSAGIFIAGPDLPGFAPDNVALNNANQRAVNLGVGTNFAADTMSVAFWLKHSGGVVEGDRLFTNNVHRSGASTADSFQINLAVGVWNLVIATGNDNDPNMQLGLPDTVFNIKDNQWHHVVVVRNGDNVNNALVVIDGIDYTSMLTPTSADWGTTGTNAHIGTRVDGVAVPGHDYTNRGAIDEMAIWLDRALTVDEAIRLYQAALVPEPASLALLTTGALLMVRRRRR